MSLLMHCDLTAQADCSFYRTLSSLWGSCTSQPLCKHSASSSIPSQGPAGMCLSGLETYNNLQPVPKERMPKSEMLTKLQDQDDRTLKAVGQHKQVAHSTLRSGEHIKKKLRLYVQSEHANQGASQVGSGNGQSGALMPCTFLVFLFCQDGIHHCSAIEYLEKCILHVCVMILLRTFKLLPQVSPALR